MYGRGRIVILILALIAAFILFMVIAYYVYPLINPEAGNQSTEISVAEEVPDYYEYDYIRFGPERVLELQDQIAELEEELAGIESKEQSDLQTIDSLYNENMEKERQIARLEAQLAQGGGGESDGVGLDPFAGGGTTGIEGDAKLQRIARSLLTLDEEELGPILNRLSDAQLVQLYNASSNIRRAKLMRSLDPGKAAVLLRRVMG